MSRPPIGWYFAALVFVVSVGEVTAQPSFGPRTNYPTGASPQMAAVGDLNGDGVPDVAWVNYGPASNSVSVALGTGGGAFGPRTDYSVGTNPASVAIGDLNADGLPDLVVANWSSANVSVLLGTGGGAFGPKTNYSTSAGRPISGTLADLDSDGDLDILVADWSANVVRRLLNNGAGVFGSLFSYNAGSQAYSIVLGDLNGDGRRDVVVANRGTTQISVLLGLAGGGFGAPASFAVGSDPISVSLGDVNGDGNLDVAVANFGSGTVSVLPGTGLGGFGTKTDYAAGATPRSVWIADLDLDTKLDIAVSDYPGNVLSVLPGNGLGSFSPRINFATAAGPTQFAVADLNADARPDVVVPCAIAESLSVLINSPPVGVPSAANSTCPTQVRVSSDGSCCFDVIVRDLANNPVPGASVVTDFGPCAMSFSPTQPPGIIINEAANTAQMFTNAAGVAHFCINATSASPCNANISANGVLLCSNASAQTCPPDSVCTPGAWKLVASSGPPLRYGHAMASVTNHYSVVMFGGRAGSTLLEDTWVWDGYTWAQKSPAHHPSARYGHAMTYDHYRDRVVLFGGLDASGAQADTWEWDGTDWTQVATTGPAARDKLMLAYDLDRQLTYLYGGSPLRADMWQWDGTNWTQICSSCDPGARESATMAFDIGRGRTFLFGGIGSSGTDLTQWVWDGANWVAVPSGSSLPLPASARDQSSTYANSCNAVVMFGGESGGDTWSWSGAYWFRVPTSQPQRVRYALSYDLFQDRPIMFGGYDPAAGTASLSTGTWEWCSPCDTPLLPTDSLGHGIYPSDDGPVADADTVEVIDTGLVHERHPGYDTSTNAWLSQYPCDFGFGGDEDPEDEDWDPQAELDSLDIDMTPEELQDSLTTWNAQIGAAYNNQPPPPLGAVGLPYVFPSKPHCPEVPNVFGGRDIIFIHGFRTTPLKEAVTGSNDSARVGWQIPTQFPGSLENPGFYGDGYWKKGAEKYWREHIRHFLTQRGNKNRYLIVAWPVTQRLSTAIQCVLTQISDAMQYGIGVVDPSGKKDCSNFGTPNFVVVSHSTGGLLTGSMMAAAKDHTNFPNLNADFIADLCKGEVALNGAISGSNEALALAKLANAGGQVINGAQTLCKLADAMYPWAELDCDELDFGVDLSYVLNGVTIDLCPSVAVGTWGPFQNASPIRTVTMAGGHPTTNGADQGLWNDYPFVAKRLTGLIKHHILNGLDDAVVENQNACANPEPYTTAYGYFGRKRDVKDKGLKANGMRKRAKGYFRDQWKDEKGGDDGGGIGFQLVNIGANDGVSPWGMVQPDHYPASQVQHCVGSNCNMLTGHDPGKRYNHHYSFMESASDHYGTTPGFDATPPFMGPNQEYYEYTTPDNQDEANSEETLAITDDEVYDPFSMPHYPDNAPMLKRGLPTEEYETIGVKKRRKKNGKTVYKWQRTYHRAQGWRTKVLGDYMYECVLSDPPPPCSPVCCARPPSGILAWYTGELGTVAGDPNSVFDAVKPRAQGTLTNGAVFMPGGKVGDGFWLDGVDDYVHVPDKLKLRLGNQFTISAWIYAQAASGSRVIIDKGSPLGYALRLDAGRPEFIIRSAGCTKSILADQISPLADSCWHHVVATRQGTVGSIYVDGVLVASDNIPCAGGIAGTQPLEIGGLPGDPGTCFAGFIDEVALWNRALAPAEIDGLWAAGTEGMCRESWWVPSVISTRTGQASFKPVICNYTKASITAHYAFVPRPIGGLCTVAGPTAFNPAGGSQTILPGGCAILPTVTATLPAGMTIGASSCYSMQAWFRENEVPECYQIANGRIVRGLSIWDVLHGSDTALLIPSDAMTATAQVRFDVRNLGAGPQSLPYRITIVPTDGDTTGMAILRLNGLPVLEPVTGTLNVAAGATAQVNVNVSASNLLGGRTYDVVFSYDMDGDSILDPVTAIGLGGFEDQELVDVEGEPAAHFETLRWLRANPNPFTESSIIEFELATAGAAEIEIFDIAGRKLRDLSQPMLAPGVQRVAWDGRDARGRVAGTGVYMIRVRAHDRATSAKVLLVRQRR